MYWQGQCIDFLPNDIHKTLPKIFDPNWKNGVGTNKDNQIFIKEEEKEKNHELFDKMNMIINDKKFEGFRALVIPSR